MKIAIYGGSFNPPHSGHVHVAEAVAQALQPDRFLILPDNLPPHKTLAEGSPSAAKRLEMCRLAFSGISSAEVSDMELTRGGLSYTSDTVKALSKSFPGSELYLVIGSDMLATFTRWHEFEYLLSRCVLLAISRESDAALREKALAEELITKYSADVRVISCSALPASSTDVRLQIASGVKPVVLPDEVYEYIKANHLYGC